MILKTFFFIIWAALAQPVTSDNPRNGVFVSNESWNTATECQVAVNHAMQNLLASTSKGGDQPLLFSACIEPLTPMVQKGEWKNGPIRQYVYAELGRDHIQSASELAIMRRDHEWKIVVYPGEDDGELYDLVNDPNETKNLWRDPAYRQQIDQAVTEVLAWATLGNFRSNRPKPLKPQSPMKIE